ATNKGLPNWQWLEFVLALRLDPESGPLFARSAAEHGISLSGSFEPFESALTKYYEVPTFDAEGNYLWGFLPLAMPAVNYDPSAHGWAHYRQVLADMDRADRGQLGAIELPGLERVDEMIQQYGPTGGFILHASPFPPIASDSFVLVRNENSFELVKYGTIQA